MQAELEEISLYPSKCQVYIHILLEAGECLEHLVRYTSLSAYRLPVVRHEMISRVDLINSII